MNLSRAANPDVSLVVTVGNAEEKIGKAVRRLAQHLRAAGARFEIVAVNDGSWDTSFAVLTLLTAEIPELRLLPRNAEGRAFLRGVSEARGGTVILMETERALGSLAGLRWTIGRIDRGSEAVVVRGRWVGARRLPAISAVARARGRGDTFERSFEREASELTLEVIGAARRPQSSLLAPVLRFLTA